MFIWCSRGEIRKLGTNWGSRSGNCAVKEYNAFRDVRFEFNSRVKLCWGPVMNVRRKQKTAVNLISQIQSMVPRGAWWHLAPQLTSIDIHSDCFLEALSGQSSWATPHVFPPFRVDALLLLVPPTSPPTILSFFDPAWRYILVPPPTLAPCCLCRILNWPLSCFLLLSPL